MEDTAGLRELFERFSLISLFIVLCLVLFTSLTTGSSLFTVLLGFLPTILTIIFCILIYEDTTHSKLYTWLVPLALIPAFYLVWTANTPLTTGLSVSDLIGVNLFLSILYLLSFFLAAPLLVQENEEPNKKRKKSRKAEDASNKKKKKNVKKQPPQTAEVRRPKTNYNRAVLIGEKCKSLNYTIGQVYDLSKGGIKELRDMIHFDRESYNGLVDYYAKKKEGKSTITRETALGYLNTIIENVRRLNRSEKEVFGTIHKALKNLERDSDGSDKIIEVLAQNSRSPVYAAQQTLLATCKEVKQDIKE